MRLFNPEKLWPPRDPKYDEVVKSFALFKRHELEIGAGTGLHSLELAFNRPSDLIVGVERTANKFNLFLKNSNVKNLKNLVPVHADVIPWLWFLNKSLLFDKIWILYPNPEIKRQNQRWIRATFFSHLLSRLKPQGEIEFATNLHEYADEVHRLSQSNWGLTCSLNNYSGPPRTLFEKKYLERHETCFQLVLKKHS